jgi:hypothetical protein
MNWPWAMLCGSPAVGKSSRAIKGMKGFSYTLLVPAVNVRFSLDIRFDL